MGFAGYILKRGRFLAIANAAALAVSYYWSLIVRRPWLMGHPVSLSVEPTTSCNLRCPQCPSGLRTFSRPTGNLDPELLKNLLDEIGRYLLYMSFYFQGEPYLHPAFCEMVQMASNRGIYTTTSTNAHFLDDKKAKETVLSGLNRMIVSIDGVDQAVYERYRRGGDLNKALEGVRTLLKWRRNLQSKTPFVELQFIVFKHNLHQVPAIRKIGKELGVDKVVLKTAQVLDQKQAAVFLPENTSLSRYRQDADGRWVVKSKPVNRCWRMWSGTVMCWDGRMVPCCFDKDAQNSPGSYEGKNFVGLWKNDRYQSFRKQILNNRSAVDMCFNCSEHKKVWL